PQWPVEPDDLDVNPPWERESGRIPVPQVHGNPPTPPGPDASSATWRAAMEESMPGVGMGDMTGTGKIPAVVPLTPHESGWSKGLRAPQGGAIAARGDVEIDQQPSAHMRALKAGNLMRATAIVSAALLLSRVLGLARTTLFSYTFGTTPDANVFTLAFTLPDAIFSIVAGGALASAFIPVFADYLIEKRDRQTAWHIASSAMNLCLLALTALALIAFIFAPQFLELTLHPRPDQAQEVVHLTRIMLLQPIFLGGATIAVAILQARQYFVLPAIGQVIYTASLIGGILATNVDERYKIFGGHLGINGPAWGVVVGAALQFAIQIPGLFQAKMAYRPIFDIFHPGVRAMFLLMVPRLINAVFLYISVFFNRGLLNSISEIAAYGYVTAFTLVMLPIGIFGQAVSQAAFPTLAALVAAGEWERLRETILRTVRGVIYLGIPSSLGLIVLAQPICSLLLAHGSKFDPRQLPAFTQPLIFFSIGLLGLSLVEILTRCFYALHDSRTAVEVSVLQFLFVIALSIILLQPMGASGLALATALGSNGEALVLLLLLRPRLGGFDMKTLGIFTLNVLAASVVTALAALFVYTLGTVILPVGPTSPRETIFLTIRLGAAILSACVVYFGFSRFLGIDDVISLDRIARRILRR
ncbi:MAG: murein biosynthesis integral membrane protein MurJ, partial [Ktedonobacterales bacterium]